MLLGWSLGVVLGDERFELTPDHVTVGLARDEHTFEPRAYMESLPTDLTGHPVLVLDPMLATGGSLEHCCRLLAERRPGGRMWLRLGL